MTRLTRRNRVSRNRVTRKHGGFLFLDKGKSKTLDKYIMINKLKEEDAKKTTKNNLVLMSYEAMMHLSVEKMRKNPKKYCDKIIYRIKKHNPQKNDVLYKLLNDIIHDNPSIKNNPSTKHIFEFIKKSK